MRRTGIELGSQAILRAHPSPHDQYPRGAQVSHLARTWSVLVFTLLALPALGAFAVGYLLPSASDLMYPCGTQTLTLQPQGAHMFLSDRSLCGAQVSHLARTWSVLVFTLLALPALGAFAVGYRFWVAQGYDLLAPKVTSGVAATGQRAETGAGDNTRTDVEAGGGAVTTSGGGARGLDEVFSGLASYRGRLSLGAVIEI
jgi:hypothetical protein